MTDPALDSSPSIKNWLVQGYHTGGGTKDQAYHSASLLTDAGSLPAPFSWQVQSSTDFDAVYPAQHHVSIRVGQPTPACIASF